MIGRNDPQFWRYAAVTPETSESLSFWLFPTGTIVLTKRFLRELQKEHDVAYSHFCVDGTRAPQAALFEETSDFGPSHMEIGTAPNIHSKWYDGEPNSSQTVFATRPPTQTNRDSRRRRRLESADLNDASPVRPKTLTCRPR